MEWETVLQSLGWQGHKMIYTAASVAVYAGEYRQYPAVFKILRLQDNVNYQEVERECQQMLSVQHENVVLLYHYQWAQMMNGYYLVMILEACDKDLAKDIRDRANNRFMYSDDEMWNITVTLIRAFAYMQRQGLAHRDIKPENIFLSRGIVKIGDFGSARNSQTDQMTATLIGTPIYLSPVLRQGFSSHQQQVTHNVFKSDVYSLGLTLLALAALQPPIFTLNGGDAIVQNTVWALQYRDDIKSVLSWMLIWDEGNRPDFVKIDEWITATYYSQPVEPSPIPPQPVVTPQAFPQSVSSRPIVPQTMSPAPVAPMPAVHQARYGERGMEQPSAVRANIPAPVTSSEEVKIQVEPRKANVGSASRAQVIELERREEEKKAAQSHFPEYEQIPPKNSIAPPKPPSNPIISPQQQPPHYLHYDEQFPGISREYQKPQCLYCHSVIEPNSDTVQLKCDPDYHLFCSVECFSNEVRRQQKPLQCPLCKAPIDQEDLDCYCVRAEPPGFIGRIVEWITDSMCCSSKN